MLSRFEPTHAVLLVLALFGGGCRRSDEEAERKRIDAMLEEAKPDFDLLPRYIEEPDAPPTCHAPLEGPVLVVGWHGLERALADKDGRRSDPPVFAEPYFEGSEQPRECEKFGDWVRNAVHGRSSVVRNVHECLRQIKTVIVFKASSWKEPTQVDRETFESGNVFGQLTVFRKDGTVLCGRKVVVGSDDQMTLRQNAIAYGLKSDLEGKLVKEIQSVIRGEPDPAATSAASPSSAARLSLAPRPVVSAAGHRPASPPVAAPPPPPEPPPAPRPAPPPIANPYD